MKPTTAKKSAMHDTHPMQAAMDEAHAVVANHRALGVAIARQVDLRLAAEETVKRLRNEIPERELQLALAYDDPELAAKTAEVEQMRRDLEQAIRSVEQSQKNVAALDARSAEFSDAVATAREKLLEEARIVAAAQHEAICAEIREASKALAIAIGKARGVGFADVRPFAGFLDVSRLPDPTDFHLYFSTDGERQVAGASLLDPSLPGVSEATESVAAGWVPLIAVATALRHCRPFKTAQTAQAPYEVKGWTETGVTNPIVADETEVPLEGFAAHRARKHEPYEIQSWREEFGVYPAPKGQTVEAAGANTREFLTKIEADGVSQ